jgi:flavin reductase (DIM6/NTAB) family NADH-FMN oxidoreductase RutF
MPVTAAEFRKALGRFASGVTVVTVARQTGQIHGMTATAFASVSLEPLMVLVCVDRRARTHPLICAQKRFAVNVLREEQEAFARYFALPDQDHESGEALGVRYTFTEQGTPLLEGCLAYLECRLVSAHDAGDHTIFLGEVEHAEVREGRPLLYFAGAYRRLHLHPT